MNLLVLIFSRDRAMQLDAALRSLFLHCKDIEIAKIRVLYATSNERHARQYLSLGQDFSHLSNLRFEKEANFHSDTIAILAPFTNILFLVDDNIFVNDFLLAQACEALQCQPQALGCSLRLGKNTTYCYSLNQPQRVPSFTPFDPGFIIYNWPGAEHDFGYPLELSSSIYRTSDLIPFLSGLDFHNPNSLEAQMDLHKVAFRDTHPSLISYQQSVTFCTPVNKVQTVAQDNRVGFVKEYQVENLMRLYDQGFRINIDSYQGWVPKACHEEVELKFKNPCNNKTQQNPLVSVIIPCFNQADYLPDAVKSVIDQEFRDWELIIVNDGSPDETGQVAHRLIAENPGYQLRYHEKPNGGLADARNAGIALASGRYILPLDADDILKPQALKRLVDTIETRSDVQIVYSDYENFGEKSGYVKSIDQVLFDVPNRPLNGLPYCALYTREVWETVGGYNRNMIWGYEDWDFWLGCLEKGFHPWHLNEALLLYRVKAASMITQAMQHDAELKAQMILNHPTLFDHQTFKWAIYVQAQEKIASNSDDPTDPEVISARLKSLQIAGEWSFSRRDLASAQSAFEAALQLMPDDPQLMLGLCNILFHKGELEAAQKIAESVLAIGEDELAAFIFLAELLLLLQKDQEAKQVIHKALVFEPENPHLQMLLTATEQKLTASSTRIASYHGRSKSKSGKKMQVSPLVSVIVPTYNRPEMLTDTLKSIMEQSFTNFEVIVVNDAGKDVLDVISRFNASGKIRYLRHPSNRGLGAARNTGIRFALGKYIAYLDDDDTYCPNHLQTLVDQLEQSNTKVVYSDALRVLQEMQKGKANAGKYVTKRKDLIFSHNFDPDLLLVKNYIPVLCFMHTRESVIRVGLFDESLSVYEDWDLWIRLSRKYAFKHIPIVTCEYTFREDGTSMSGSRTGFQELLPVIYERYQQYSGDKPGIAEAQERQLKNARQVLSLEKARKTLKMLFDQPDFSKAVQENIERIDQDVLKVLQLNSQNARAGEDILQAERFEAIAAFLEQQLAAHKAQIAEPLLPESPVLSSAAKMLEMLLSADDLASSLEQNAEKLTPELLALVRSNAAVAQADGDIDLAEGLKNLADYIEELSPS